MFYKAMNILRTLRLTRLDKWMLSRFNVVMSKPTKPKIVTSMAAVLQTISQLKKHYSFGRIHVGLDTEGYYPVENVPEKEVEKLKEISEIAQRIRETQPSTSKKQRLDTPGAKIPADDGEKMTELTEKEKKAEWALNQNQVFADWQPGYPKYRFARQEHLAYIQISSPYNVNYIFPANKMTKEMWQALNAFLADINVVLVGYDIKSDIEWLALAFGLPEALQYQLETQTQFVEGTKIEKNSPIYKEILRYSSRGGRYRCVDVKVIIDNIENPPTGWPKRIDYAKRGIHFEGKKLCHVIQELLGLDIAGLQIDFKSKANRPTIISEQDRVSIKEQLYMSLDALGSIWAFFALLHEQLFSSKFLDLFPELEKHDKVTDAWAEQDFKLFNALIDENKRKWELNRPAPYLLPWFNPETKQEEILVDHTRWGQFTPIRQAIRNKNQIRMAKSRISLYNPGNPIDRTPKYPASKDLKDDSTMLLTPILDDGIHPEVPKLVISSSTGLSKQQKRRAQQELEEEAAENWALEQEEGVGPGEI